MSSPSPTNLKVLDALPGDAWSDAYLASAPGHEHLVLRMLKPEVVADAARVDRFLAGAQALKSLRHGAVVSVHSAGKTHDGKVFVLTDHVEGETLAMKAPLPLEQVVDVGVPLADALGAAHSLGLVHGALTSARVVMAQGGPRLDFSLAPLLREESADAAGDIKSLVALLQAQLEADERREGLAQTLKHALQGLPDARALRDRLQGLRRGYAPEEHSRTALSQQRLPQAPEAGPPMADPDLTGAQLGNYAIERVLGEGAMGRVYLARHLRIGRKAAIKVLKAAHAGSRDLVARFIQEATAVNAIKNDHIVEVYDFGEEPLPDGHARVYCVMELLEGTSLADEMLKAPLRLERAVGIVQQVARALGAAHAVGVVHRDIKPDNIFLGQGDFVKVLDFGVAKLLKQIGDIPKAATTAGLVIGTPEYMAPEQALGLPTDLRADVYAVGLLLYELLCGVQPFVADTFAKLVVEIAQRAPPPLPERALSGEPIPRALENVIMRCLAKRPDERYASTEELARALEPFSGRPQAEEAPSQAEAEAIAAMRPKPGRALLIAFALLALLGGAGYWAQRPHPEPPAPAAAPSPPPVEQVALEVQSEPPGARVTRTDTGEALGVTPLQVKLDRREGGVAVRLELDGRQTVERQVSLSRDNSLLVDLSALPPPAPEQPEKPALKSGASKKKAAK